MNPEFVALRVLEARDEIGGDAKTVVFDVPAPLAETFKWRAGQHVTVRFNIRGQEERRAYSISSSPYSGEALRITVKRVKKGLVSNYIADNIKAGDMVEVMPPFGHFCLDPGPKLRRTHYFFGAGSGITPMYSMLETVLLAEPWSTAHLVYGNMNADTIIFKEKIAELQKQFPDRLTVRHVLFSPSMWSSFEYWRKGIIGAEALEQLMAEDPPYAQDVQYYICGPGTMNSDMKNALMAIDVPKDRIHIESYGGADSVDSDDSVKGVASQATITLNGSRHQVSIKEGQTVLEAVREADLTIPFSCQSGVCGACRGQIQDGAVHMRNRMALEDSEINGGAFLACQSVPTEGRITVKFD